MLVNGLSMLVVAWVSFATGFTLYAIWRIGRVRSRRAILRVGDPREVLVLRPLDQPSALDLACLATPIAHDAAVEHIVLAPDEPAGLPPTVRWIASDPTVPNRKVGHLLHGLAQCDPRGRAVLAIDADVRVDGALIAALTGPLARGIALSAAPPAPERARGLAAWATRALLCHTHQSFVALDAVRAGAPSPCGKALGLGEVAQHELRALADVVGEDLELARRLHARGERIELVGSPAVVPQRDDGPMRLPLDRFARWMQVLRAHRAPLFPTVPLLLAPTPSLVVIALVLAPWARAPLCAVGTLLVARTLLARRLDVRDAWAWPLGEGLLLAAWLRALVLGRRIRWRGRDFRVRPGGQLHA